MFFGVEGMKSKKKPDDGLCSSDEKSSDYRSMDRKTLENLAVSAIREHRSLLAADQEVYDEWTRASEDPSVSSSIVETLQTEFLSRQRKSETQQSELSDIIDALGYVPEVPEDENVGELK